MGQAKKIFLSIRPAKLKDDGFEITARKRKIDDTGRLYFKELTSKGERTKVSGLKHLIKHEHAPFISEIKSLLTQQESKNILFFIHGYHPFKKKLHTVLLDRLATEYSKNEEYEGVGAIIFFSWPNRGLQWKEDDEAKQIGEVLGEYYPRLFLSLKEMCHSMDGKFHLMCQSFGHHILNGFLSKYPFKSETLFDKTFLMAADIPNKAVTEPRGVEIVNHIGRSKQKTIVYNLLALKSVSGQTYIYYDEYDVILTASKINFLRNHPRLGMTGPLQPYSDYFEVPNNETYNEGMNLGAKISMKRIPFKIIFQQKKYNKRHQYFISNELVVKMINEEISK
ncbi:MAG: alpha/beta hydrolase [Reichenbachiella sp.]